jgi:hypothetical protein
MSTSHKILLVALMLFTFVNGVLLLMYNGGTFSFCERSYFIPFSNTEEIFNSGKNWDVEVYYLDLYDYSEFFAYCGGTWLLYFVYRLFAYNKKYQ